MNLSELTEKFRELDAPDPESWAQSQLNEGINQLGRYTFLKGMWDQVVPDNEDWIDNVMKNYTPGENEPHSGLGLAISKMLEQRVPKSYITEFARALSSELLFGIGYLIDDPSSVEGNDSIDWALMQLNDDGEPIDTICGLHESILETDPENRECCPRPEHIS